MMRARRNGWLHLWDRYYFSCCSSVVQQNAATFLNSPRYSLVAFQMIQSIILRRHIAYSSHIFHSTIYKLVYCLYMQVTVYGASGRVGRLVVAALLASDYTVVAFVHSRNPFTAQPNLQIFTGSVDDTAAVTAAAAGSHLLISTLGSWGTKSKDVVSTGTAAMIQAASEHGIKRIITLTGSSAFCVSDKPTLADRLTHRLLSMIAGQILNDGETHLKLLEASGLDWTAIRSPAMLGFGSSDYRLIKRLSSLVATIPRRAVVACLVDRIKATDEYGKAPVIRRG